jgi:glycosyltransferase involved in cell wall biosynthesis
MRVIHVIHGVDFRAGGPIVAIAGMCTAQQQAGLDVTLLATFREGARRDLADDLRAAGVQVTLVGPVSGPLASHPTLDDVMEKAVAEGDVVHIHALFEAVQHSAAKAARRQGKPYFVTPHGMLTPWSLRQKRLKKAIYMTWRLRKDLNRAAALHFTTVQERDESAKVRLAPPAIVESLGVDLREFETLPPRGTFRDRHPQLAGKRIVMFLGRLHPGKGMEYLIPALAVAKMPDVMLVAVGPDSQGFQAKLESLVDEYGVRDQVLFTGMLRGRDRIEALTDADLFALTSEHENFGVAVIEALACGVPALVADGVGISDDIVSSRVGSSVPLDISIIAMELRRWMQDETLRRAAAEKARPFVWEHFDWSVVAARWVDHYRKLVASR